MLQSTQDIWYLVLSVCVGALTLFLCVFLFHWISLVRKVNRAVNGIAEKIQQLHNLMNRGFGHLGLVSEGVKMLIEYFLSRRDSGDSTSKNKKKK